MISMNKKYTTRDGRPVRLLCVDCEYSQPVIGLIENKYCESWNADGRRYGERISDSCDLIEAKTKRSGWINIYEWAGKLRTAYFSDTVFNSKEDADKYKGERAEQHIATIKIEWEE